MEQSTRESKSPGEVTLLELLDAREARAAYQQSLLNAYHKATLICLTVNMPGPVKRTALACRVFAAGMGEAEQALAEENIPLLFSQRRVLDTGCEGYLVAEGDGAAIKQLMCALEESLPYGRLLDADVHTLAGQISRTQVGYPTRGCMVCGKPGRDCASRRLHPLTEILQAFEVLAQTAPETEA